MSENKVHKQQIMEDLMAIIELFKKDASNNVDIALKIFPFIVEFTSQTLETDSSSNELMFENILK